MHIGILERWLDLAILIAAMDLFFGYQYTGVLWNAHGIFCFAAAIILVCVKVIIDVRGVLQMER